VLAYSARQLAMLVLVLPIALAGVGVWIVPFLSTRHVAPRFRPALDQVATYKLGTAMLAFPLWLALLTGTAWLAWGLRPALLTLVLLPLTGLAAVAWHDRQADVREDLRIFVRARRLPRGRDRLVEQRAHLTEEFDRLVDEWRAEAGDRSLAGGAGPG
jgi:hypothetical protein